jgi:hypothetical protein
LSDVLSSLLVRLIPLNLQLHPEPQLVLCLGLQTVGRPVAIARDETGWLRTLRAVTVLIQIALVAPLTVAAAGAGADVVLIAPLTDGVPIGIGVRVIGMATAVA